MCKFLISYLYAVGKSYVISSQKSMHQCVESLIQKLTPGVVLHFQKMPVSLAVPSKHMIQVGRASPVPMETESGDSTDAMKTDGSISHLNHLKTSDTGRDTPPPPLYSQQQSKLWSDTKKMIYVKTNPKGSLPTGHWPIPESYWPDINLQTLVSTFLYFHI